MHLIFLGVGILVVISNLYTLLGHNAVKAAALLLENLKKLLLCLISSERQSVSLLSMFLYGQGGMVSFVMRY